MFGTTNQSNTMRRLNRLIAVGLIGFGLTAASSYGTTFDWSFVYPGGHKVSGQLDGDMNTSTGVMHVDNVTNVTVFIDGSAMGGPIVVAASPVVSVDPMQCNFSFQPSAGGMVFEIVPTGVDTSAITETFATVTSGAGLTVDGPAMATTFNTSSDRNVKEHFDTVNPQEVLDQVAGLAIWRWNFKADEGTPHIGPTAQDFYAAFSVGSDDRHIATVDADGVALAAIQGLNQKLEETRAENADLRARLEKLERLVQSPK